VVVGCCVRKREAGEGVWAKKPKPSARARFRVQNSEGYGVEGWCGGVYEVVAVVGLCTRETRGREGVWGQIRNRAVVARFRTRRVKRGRGIGRRGSAVVRTR